MSVLFCCLLIWTNPKFHWCIYKYSDHLTAPGMSLIVNAFDRWKKKNMKIKMEMSDLDHNVD